MEIETYVARIGGITVFGRLSKNGSWATKRKSISSHKPTRIEINPGIWGD
jgi:hypothetical protein